MITIHLYWSNICILHRQELMFLEKIKKELEPQGICLQVTCFGLGYGTHMSEYMLAHPEDALPDMFVSTDLEIYEDARIFNRFRDSLLPLTRLLQVKQTEDVPKLYRGECLLPYVAIPMVFYGTYQELSEGAPSFSDLVKEGHSVTFGGINNSAAKTVAKLIWETQGEETARRFLTDNTVTDMPIQAFHRVKTGQSSLSLVPSVYAIRADGLDTLALCPADGAIAIPSYICARDTVPEWAAQAVIEALLSPEIMEFYRMNGNLICCNAESPKEPWMERHGQGLQLPSKQFLDSLKPEAFVRMYRTLAAASC